MVNALILWADDASPNLGVRVLSRGAESLIRRVLDSPLEVSRVNFGDSSVKFGPAAIFRDFFGFRRPIRQLCANHELIFDTGAGDSFADIYGLRRLLVLDYVRWTAVKRANRTLISLPQTIGPFESPLGAQLGAFGARMGEAWFARDHVSLAYARDQLGVTPKPSTDLVFALDDEASRGGPKNRDVLLNVSGLIWNSSTGVDASEYRSLIHSLVDSLQHGGREVGLIAHVLDNPSTDNDVPVVKQLAEETGCEAIIPNDLDHARRLIAGSRLLIGSRMHACLNALSVGVPAVAMAYSRKFTPLFAGISWWPAVELAGGSTDLDHLMGLISEVEADAEVRIPMTLRHASQLIEQTVSDMAAALCRTPVEPLVKEELRG